MALKVGELYAALSLKKDAFTKGLADSEGRARQWGSKVGNAFKLASLAIVGALAIAVVAIAAIGIKSLDNAQEQEYANARVKAAFGKSAEAVNQWASDNARSLAVADDNLQNAVAGYQIWAKNVGMSTKEATAHGQELAVRAAEIANATGKDFDTVFAALQKGEQGATRGLKAYGVVADSATLKAKALEMGIYNGSGALTAQQTAAATHALVMEQTAKYTGMAADAQDGMAYKSRQMGVMVDEVMDNIGAIFMEVALEVLPLLSEGLSVLSGFIQENMPTIRAVIQGAMAGVRAAFAFIAENVLPALGAAFAWFVENILPSFTSSTGVVQKTVLPALGKAFDFITTEVVPALGAVFKWIAENIFPILKNVFNLLTTVILPALATAFKAVQGWIKDNWPTISTIVKQVSGFVKSAFDVISAVIKAVMPVIIEVAKVVFPILGAAASTLLKAMSTAFTAIGNVWKQAMSIAKTVVSAIGGAWSGLTSTIAGVWSKITSTMKGAINNIIRAVNGFIRAINGIQIHIPGIDAGPVHIEGFNWNGLNLGSIPYLAKGARNFRGGFAMVGEEGPELVRLPKGSDVYSNRESGMMGGGPLIGEQHIYGVQPGDVEAETKRAIRRATLHWKLEGGRA